MVVEDEIFKKAIKINLDLNLVQSVKRAILKKIFSIQ